MVLLEFCLDRPHFFLQNGAVPLYLAPPALTIQPEGITQRKDPFPETRRTCADCDIPGMNKGEAAIQYLLGAQRDAGRQLALKNPAGGIGPPVRQGVGKDGPDLECLFSEGTGGLYGRPDGEQPVVAGQCIIHEAGAAQSPPPRPGDQLVGQ